MSKSKKGRKILVFSGIIVVVAGLTAAAVLRKREPVFTVQTEKVTRRNLTELVVANGRIQPVIQVKISPEVSGEIIELPVKEGQAVNKGDLLVKIKPDFYVANRNQAEASYKSSLAGKSTSEASLQKADLEFKRHQELFQKQLISDSVFLEVKTARDIALAQLTSATHQVEMSKAMLARAEEELLKTTITSPLTGTISKLNSQLGERVLGTIQNVGTEIMIVSDLNEMEARVDIGEIDVVLIAPNQHVRLEVDAFKNKKFSGTVTEIANSSKGAGFSSSGTSQEATKFEVRIRVKEKEAFRPGMSVTAEIETRSRTNALTIPIASVTTRLPKAAGGTNTVAGATNAVAGATNKTGKASGAGDAGTNYVSGDRKSKEASKPIEVVFVMDGDQAKMVPVKIGISDDSYWEVTEGLKEDQEIVSGPFRAISRDLEDGKKIRKGPPPSEKPGDKDAEKK
jgi:HlyD family secretion protein